MVQYRLGSGQFGRVGMTQTDAAQMRQHDRALDREHTIECPDGSRMLVGAEGRKAPVPRRVLGQRVDAVYLVGHHADPMRPSHDRRKG